MIELKNICVKYGDVSVIDSLNFRFEDGSLYGISGASGMGKTTLINVICGLLKPTHGELINTHERHSYVFQDARLFPWMTAFENVACVCKDEQKAKHFLDLLLPDCESKYPHELSGGMKQRVSIARALAYDAPLVLLDEPFKGLDTQTKQSTINTVLECIKGRTAILISHSEEELFLCDKVYKLNGNPVNELIEVKSGSVAIE